MAERVGIPFFKTGNPEQDHERWWVTDFTREQIETKIAALEQRLDEAKAALRDASAGGQLTMAGICSAHFWYDRDCPQCQSEVPEWVITLEQRLRDTEQRAERYKAALESIANMPRLTTPRVVMIAAARAALAEPQAPAGE